MPPQRTYNERRARVHLTKKKHAYVHTHAYNVHVMPINVLRIFSYPKFCCLIFHSVRPPARTESLCHIVFSTSAPLGALVLLVASDVPCRVLRVA